MNRPPSSLQSFFAEMKRRRVFRVMAVYGAAAFVVLQVVDIVFPVLELPDWTTRLVLALVLIGFPFAVVLAWAFEATPEGVKRTAPAAPEEIRDIVAEPARRRLPSGLLALAAMILLFGTGWWMGADHGESGSPNLLVSQAQAAGFETVAALPFRNMNGDEDNGVIALGIHEDLLSQLSRIAALRVTSSTSVQEYAETDKSLAEIAKDLGVQYLLEGSVQSSGSRVRVNVRLVDGATDQQMWSKQFDQDVTPENLFDIQSEISRTVVDALQAQLTPEEDAALDATVLAGNSVAQQWYYRGLSIESRGGLSEIAPARDAFAQAVELDSTYVAAWSQLARLEARRAFIGDADGGAARAAMERTQQLAPNSVEAHLARGYYEYYAQRNFDAALSAFRAAERQAPSDAAAVWAVGLILRRQGDFVGSTEMMKKAVLLDPRNPVRLETLFENLVNQGAYAAADEVIERSLSLDPANSRARSYKISVTVYRDGRTDRARRLAGELRLDPRAGEEAVALARMASMDRDWDRLLEIGRTVDTGGAVNMELLAEGWRQDALVAKGDTVAARAIADSIVALVSPSTVTAAGGPEALRGSFLAAGGRREEALPLLREADRQLRHFDDHVIVPDFAAAVVDGYGRIGEIDAGFALLDQMIDHPGEAFTTATLRLSPIFDPYRDDPRFADILRRREKLEAEGARLGEAGRPWMP
jgi:TolB-like protein/Flp pilus assembly protein TadD